MTPVLSRLFCYLLVGSLFLLSVQFIFLPHTASAQTVGLECSFGGLPVVALSDEEPVVSGDSITVTVNMQNGSDHTFSGMRLGLALYTDASDSVPAFWTTTAEPYTLTPGASYPLEVRLDATNVPTGTYTLKPFLSQGGFGDQLALAFRDVEAVNGVMVTKSTPQSSDVAVFVRINGQEVNDQIIQTEAASAILVTTETTNRNAVPFLGATMESVIAHGAHPIGTSLSAGLSDAVKLIPGGTRVSEYVAADTEGGTYTVYTAVQKSNTLLPVQVATLGLGDEEVLAETTYLSAVGYARSADDDATVSVCVDQIGAGDQVSSPSGMMVALEGQGVSERYVFGEDGQLGNSVTFAGVSAQSLLTVTLGSPVFPDWGPAVEDAPEVSLRAVDFRTVDTAPVSFECEPNCDTEESPSDGGTLMDQGSDTPSFYFYIGIVLAAALLMYIMLRRLHPSSESEGDESSHRAELQ